MPAFVCIVATQQLLLRQASPVRCNNNSSIIPHQGQRAVLGSIPAATGRNTPWAGHQYRTHTLSTHTLTVSSRPNAQGFGPEGIRRGRGRSETTRKANLTAHNTQPRSDCNMLEGIRCAAVARSSETLLSHNFCGENTRGRDKIGQLIPSCLR